MTKNSLDLSEEDVLFLRDLKRNKVPWNMDRINQAKRLRDSHGVCEYLTVSGVAGWWTLTQKGRDLLA